MLCLKGVTDLEPNAEPIRTQFQRGNSFRLGMQPLDDRRSAMHHCSDCVTYSVSVSRKYWLWIYDLSQDHYQQPLQRSFGLVGIGQAFTVRSNV